MQLGPRGRGPPEATPQRLQDMLPPRDMAPLRDMLRLRDMALDMAQPPAMGPPRDMPLRPRRMQTRHGTTSRENHVRREVAETWAGRRHRMA